MWCLAVGQFMQVRGVWRGWIDVRLRAVAVSLDVIEERASPDAERSSSMPFASGDAHSSDFAAALTFALTMIDRMAQRE